MQATVRLNPAGGPVTAEVVFGFASIGTYEFKLYEPGDRSPKLILEGAAPDDIPDVVALQPSVGELDGRLLWLRARAASAMMGTDMVGVKLVIKQDGADLTDNRLRLGASVGGGEEAIFNFAVRFAS